MIVGVLVSRKLQTKAKTFVAKFYGAADKRVAICREIVDGAKVVKMQVWEHAYLRRIDGAPRKTLAPYSSTSRRF